MTMEHYADAAAGVGIVKNPSGVVTITITSSGAANILRALQKNEPSSPAAKSLELGLEKILATQCQRLDPAFSGPPVSQTGGTWSAEESFPIRRAASYGD